MHASWLAPSWAGVEVGALMTTRPGGNSARPWDGLNLGDHVGDDPESVAANRALFEARLQAKAVYLNQVHSARVVRVGRADTQRDAATHTADVLLTNERGIACTVLVADCLPVLMAAPDARAVAAAHAGWRGLAAGVLEAATAQLCELAACDPKDIRVWLGACIGPRRFEVGADVLAAFGAPTERPDPTRFWPVAAKDGSPKWMANLPQLARDRLARSGVCDLSGASCCTVEDGSRFFSFRRDGITGRMAAAIWIR
jgi:YfiH family protein